MSHADKTHTDPHYQIKIYGNLDREWSRWFDGMAISSELDSRGTQITSLTGVIADQAKLRGILNKIWDLNLMVISLNLLEDQCQWEEPERKFKK